MASPVTTAGRLNPNNMKRKTVQPTAGSESRKKLCIEDGREELNEPCCLVRLLAQYGILESITANLFPKELYSLATTSRAAYKTIFPRKESRSNLLKKMKCDGTGIRIRNQSHKKSAYFDQFGCTEIAMCGTQDKGTSIKSQSCVSCGITTCDECRTHCVYQSIFQPADEEDELPNFSGFVLLSQPEMGIMSPAHLGESDPRMHWNMGVHHDQGVLDSPLDSAFFAAPESIDEIINTDLGTGQLKVTYASNLPHPSPVIQTFWDITEERKRLVCDPCFTKKTTRQDRPRCHCTLKKRFLDRWLCLRCYKREREAQENSKYGTWDRDTCSLKCLCGQQVSDANARLTCLWCWGEVATGGDTSTARPP